MISTVPSNFANVITPFAPIGRQPVGEENPDLRNSTLKPLEESAETARKENRRSPDERSGEPGERQRLELGRSSKEASFSRQNQSGVAEESTDPQQAEQKAVERELAQRREQEVVQEVRQLAARDREVRAHEQAHAAVGGRYAGAPTYEFTRGPDGVSYAVAGEVSIDTSKVPNDPQATIEKAQLLRRAAFAPAEPSVTDRRVAAEAAQMEAQARTELRQQQVEEAGDKVSGKSDQEASSVEERNDQSDVSLRGADVEDTSSGGTSGSESSAPSINSADRSIDISRRLIQSGAQTNPFPPGQLFSQRA